MEEATRLSFVGFKGLQVIDRGHGHLEVRSPRKGTLWTGSKMHSRTPGLHDEIGWHASHTLAGTRKYMDESVINMRTVEHPPGSGSYTGVEIESIKHSVVALVTSAPDDNLILPLDWRSEEIEIRVLGVDGGPPWRTLAELLADPAGLSIVCDGAAIRPHRLPDFLAERHIINAEAFAVPPLTLLGDKWGVRARPTRILERIASEWGLRADYLDDGVMAELRQPDEALHADRDLLWSVALLAGDIFDRDPALCRHLIDIIDDNSSSAFLHRSLAAQVPALLERDAVLGQQVATTLAGSADDLTRLYLAQQLAALYERDPVFVRPLALALFADGDTAVRQAAIRELVGLWDVDPEFARAALLVLPPAANGTDWAYGSADFTAYVDRDRSFALDALDRIVAGGGRDTFRRLERQLIDVYDRDVEVGRILARALVLGSAEAAIDVADDVVDIIDRDPVMQDEILKLITSRADCNPGLRLMQRLPGVLDRDERLGLALARWLIHNKIDKIRDGTLRVLEERGLTAALKTADSALTLADGAQVGLG